MRMKFLANYFIVDVRFCPNYFVIGVMFFFRDLFSSEIVICLCFILCFLFIFFCGFACRSVLFFTFAFRYSPSNYLYFGLIVVRFSPNLF